jgi:leucine dehydrogenase
MEIMGFLGFAINSTLDMARLDMNFPTAMSDGVTIQQVNTWNNLVKAKEQGITPTEAAYFTCEDIIYG